MKPIEKLRRWLRTKPEEAILQIVNETKTVKRIKHKQAVCPNDQCPGWQMFRCAQFDNPLCFERIQIEAEIRQHEAVSAHQQTERNTK